MKSGRRCDPEKAFGAGWDPRFRYRWIRTLYCKADFRSCHLFSERTGGELTEGRKAGTGRRRIVQIVFFVISGVDRKNENAIIPSINAFDRGKVTAPRRAKRVPGDGKGAAAGQRSSPRERRAEAEETVRRHGRRRPLSGIEAAAGAAVNDGGTAKAISPFWLCAGRYFCFPV